MRTTVLNIKTRIRCYLSIKSYLFDLGLTIQEELYMEPVDTKRKELVLGLKVEELEKTGPEHSPWGNLLVEENFNQLKEQIQSQINPCLSFEVYQYLGLQDRNPHLDKSFYLDLWRKLNTNTLDI